MLQILHPRFRAGFSTAVSTVPCSKPPSSRVFRHWRQLVSLHLSGCRNVASVKRPWNDMVFSACHAQTSTWNPAVWLDCKPFRSAVERILAQRNSMHVMPDLQLHVGANGQFHKSFNPFSLFDESLQKSRRIRVWIWLSGWLTQQLLGRCRSWSPSGDRTRSRRL